MQRKDATRLALRGPITGFVLLLVALPAMAQKTTFDPTIETSSGYTSNVDYGGGEQVPDYFLRFAAELPVIRETATDLLEFSYRPAIHRYKDFDQLDRDEHRLRLDWNKETGRSSEFNLYTSYIRTQLQGDASSLDDSDLFLFQRTNRQEGLIGVGYDSRFSRLWTWDLQLDGAIRNYDAISDDGSSPPDSEPEVEDRDELTGMFRFSRVLSRRSSVGLALRQAWYRLEFSGDENSTQVAVTYDYEVGSRDTLAVELGGYHNTGDAAGTDPNEARTGPVFGLRWNHEYQKMDLGLYANHQPSAGGALPGTAIQTVVGLALRSSGPSNWRWGVFPRAAYRDPANPEDSGRTSAALSFEVDRKITNWMSIRLRSDYIYQEYTDPEADDRSSYTAYLGLIWMPKGGTRAGGA